MMHIVCRRLTAASKDGDPTMEWPELFICMPRLAYEVVILQLRHDGVYQERGLGSPVTVLHPCPRLDTGR